MALYQKTPPAERNALREKQPKIGPYLEKAWKIASDNPTHEVAPKALVWIVTADRERNPIGDQAIDALLKDHMDSPEMAALPSYLGYRRTEKATAALKSGRLAEEIVSVEIPQRKKDPIIFSQDEFIRPNTTMETLGGLRPAFKKDGSVTAGNASGINDGASFMLVASEEAVKEYNLTPLAEVIGIGQGGVDPSIMGMGPVPAIAAALNHVGMTLKDMDLIELNEAFAAQSLGVIEQLSRDHGMSIDDIKAITNVNGGAIALGHPVGASGNRITTTLIHEMKKQELTYGLATLCIGGGMGTAVIIKLEV